MEQEIKLLIINPGSTSTKISIFENGVERYKKSLSHQTVFSVWWDGFEIILLKIQS